MTENKDLPFQRSWQNPDADLTKYKRVEIEPMETEKLRGLGKDSFGVRSFEATHVNDARELAEFSTSQFQENIDESPGRSARITSKPAGASDALILNTNLVEAVPGRPGFQVANLFFPPFLGLLNRPSVGIEGRISNARTGETLFVFADRETPEISFFDARKFTYYGTQRREARTWAEQITKLLESNGENRIRDPFAIQPINY